MHFLFLDESYPRVESGKDIVMAVWAVEQKGFEQSLTRLQECYRLRRIKSIKSIDSTLESIDARAVIAKARLDPNIYRTGEVDGTDDIPAMARTDTIWSVCMIFLVGTLIKELIRLGIEVGAVDVFHDPKSLKAAHSRALGQTLRGLVVSLAKEFDSQRRLGLLQAFEIQRVESVEKAGGGKRLSKVQFGTWIADRLCSGFDQARRTPGLTRIVTHDMSELVRRTVQQFDGKPFNED